MDYGVILETRQEEPRQDISHVARMDEPLRHLPNPVSVAISGPNELHDFPVINFPQVSLAARATAPVSMVPRNRRAGDTAGVSLMNFARRGTFRRIVSGFVRTLVRGGSQGLGTRLRRAGSSI